MSQHGFTLFWAGKLLIRLEKWMFSGQSVIRNTWQERMEQEEFQFVLRRTRKGTNENAFTSYYLLNHDR